MVKVSITLPNNAQITFESEEPEVIHEIVGMVLRDLPRELMQAAPPVNGNGHSQTPAANGTATSPPDHHSPPPERPAQHGPETVGRGPAEETTIQPPERPGARQKSPGRRQASPAGLSEGERAFIDFCRQANPLGDMRRVVVAAEGAARYLDAQSVDSENLERLFDLAGWQRPHSLVQTLRNAARSKFRWLERVPGRSGHYTVTDLGRVTALGG